MAVVVNLAVTYQDGRTEVVRITPRAEVAWERHFDLPIGAAGQRQERLYWLAWKSLELAGKETRGFEDFLTVLDAVTLPEEASDPGPTQPTPSPPDSSD